MLLLISLSFISMSCFCLAMQKHRKHIITTELPRYLTRFLRPLSWLLLLITFYISGQLYGWSIGPAVFFGALTAALLPLILLLTYHAKMVPYVAVVLPLFTLC